MSDLKNELIKIAYEEPDKREGILEALKTGQTKEAGTRDDKVAITREDEKFIHWAQMAHQDDPVSSLQLVEFTAMNFGLEVEKEWGGSGGGPRWRKGTKAIIDTSSHNNGATLGHYKDYEGMLCTVIETHQENPSLADNGSKWEDIIVEMENGETVRLPEAQKGNRIGIKRPEPDTYDEWVEIIYSSDPSNVPSKDQIATAEAYIRRGERQGENRSYNYYTGKIYEDGIYASPKGGVILAFEAKERGMSRRHINPDSGKLFYIALRGERPPVWESEYEELVSRAEKDLED